MLWRHPLGPKPAKTATPFDLADDSHLLGTRAMATAARVSDETLYNWHADGCPCEVGTDGVRRWNKDAVLAWREKHRPEYQLKGGKRQGAGRRRGTAAKVKAMVSVGVATGATGAGGPVVNGDVIQRGRVDVGDVGGGGGQQLGIGDLVTEEVKRRADEMIAGWGELKYLMALVKSGGLSAMESATLAKAIEAQKGHLELEKARGGLVDAAEVKVAITQGLQKVRAVLDQTPDRAAGKVVSACGLPPSAIHKVRQVVAEEMNRACEGLRKALGEEEEGKAQSTKHT